jgi:hypothetical protein
MPESEEKWLAAQYRIGSSPKFKYIRKLTVEETNRLAEAKSLLTRVVLGSPHQELAQAFRALGASARFGGNSPTAQERARVVQALKHLLEVAKTIGHGWAEILDQELTTDHKDATDAISEIDSSLQSGALAVISSAVEQGDAALLAAGSDFVAPDGRRLHSQLQELLTASELLAATAIGALHEPIDDASVFIHGLAAEVLLGTALVLPPHDPKGGDMALEDLPTELVVKAQLLIAHSEEILAEGTSPISQPASKLEAEDLETDLPAASGNIDQSTADGPPVPPPQAPELDIADLANHIDHEARTSLRTWSAAIDVADLAETRDRLTAGIAAIGAELARRDAAEGGTAIAHPHPPSLASLAQVDLEKADQLQALSLTGELLGLELTLASLTRFTHVLEMQFSGDADTDYLSWNPDAVSRAISLANLLRDLDRENQGEGPSHSLSHARHCLEWGMPEAALMYVVNYIGANVPADELETAHKTVLEKARDFLVEHGSDDHARPGVALALAWALFIDAEGRAFEASTGAAGG